MGCWGNAPKKFIHLKLKADDSQTILWFSQLKNDWVITLKNEEKLKSLANIETWSQLSLDLEEKPSQRLEDGVAIISIVLLNGIIPS